MKPYFLYLLLLAFPLHAKPNPQESALSSNITGNDNAAFGKYTLYNNNGNFNTALGYNAMFFNTTGINNTATGSTALQNNVA